MGLSWRTGLRRPGARLLAGPVCAGGACPDRRRHAVAVGVRLDRGCRAAVRFRRWRQLVTATMPGHRRHGHAPAVHPSTGQRDPHRRRRRPRYRCARSCSSSGGASRSAGRKPGSRTRR
jgi:hypothetical protein